MKKVVVIVMLVLVAGAVVAQEYDGINSYDGHFWVQMGDMQKMGYVQGFLAAHAAMYERFVYENDGEETDRIVEYFYISYSVGQILDMLNGFYQTYDNRSYRIVDALYLAVWKDYWSK